MNRARFIIGLIVIAAAAVAMFLGDEGFVAPSIAILVVGIVLVATSRKRR